MLHPSHIHHPLEGGGFTSNQTKGGPSLIDRLWVAPRIKRMAIIPHYSDVAPIVYNETEEGRTIAVFPLPFMDTPEGYNMAVLAKLWLSSLRSHESGRAGSVAFAAPPQASSP